MQPSNCSWIAPPADCVAVPDGPTIKLNADIVLNGVPSFHDGRHGQNCHLDAPDYILYGQSLIKYNEGV